MAYIQPKLTDDEELKKQQEQGLAAQEGAPQSGAPIGGQPGGGEAPTGPKPAGATRQFTDVRSYLEQNRPQAQQLAQNVGSQIESEAANVQKNIGQAGEQFKQNVEAGAYRTEPNKALIQEAAMSPEEVLKRQQDVEKLKNIRTAEYKGPQSLEQTGQYSALESQAKEAQRKAGLVGTQAGREELLGLSNRPSTGGLRLDQLLLSQTPEARAALEASAKTTEGLTGALGSASQQAKEYATKAAEETAATKNLFGEQFGKAKTEFQTQLNNRLKQLVKEANDRAAAAQATLTGGLDNQALADLGVGQEDLAAYQQAAKNLKTDYGFDRNLADYLQQQAPIYNVSQAATAQDLARQQALEELSGQNIGLLGPKVGGANLDLSQFATEAAKEGTVGTLSAKDRELIDRYFARQDIGNQRQALRNALVRELEYVKGKKMADLPPGVDLTDLLATDPNTGINTGGMWRNSQDFGDKLMTALDTTFAKPVRQVGNEVTDFGSAQTEALKDIISNPKKEASKAVEKAKSAIKKAFCFVAGTPIQLVDGQMRDVADIQLGDDCAIGGPVDSIRQSLIDEPIYDYFGIQVTGHHAVCEDGQWIRVKDSKHALPFAFRGVVYSIANEEHRLIINGITFADELETNDYEDLTIDESLERLNLAGRNGKLVEVN